MTHGEARAFECSPLCLFAIHQNLADHDGDDGEDEKTETTSKAAGGMTDVRDV